MIYTKNDLGFEVGDRVVHRRDSALTGTIVHIDDDCYPVYEYGETTCKIQWDDVEQGSLDVQWTNKIELVELTRPTLAERVRQYESLLHTIQMYAEVTLDHEKLKKLVGNICRWSYAHRQGNGELSEQEQHNLVKNAFDKLLDV